MGKSNRLAKWFRSSASDQATASSAKVTSPVLVNRSSKDVSSKSVPPIALQPPPHPAPAALNVKNVNHVLDRVINEHLVKLPEIEKDAFVSASERMTSEDVLKQVKEYDYSHRNKSSLRSHAQPLARFFGILDRFLESIAIGVQANPDVSSIVVGLARLVVSVAVGFIGFFDKLSEMIARMGDHLGYLAEYSNSAGDSELVEECLANVYIDLLSFWRAACNVFVDKHGTTRRLTSWRIFWRIQWMPFEDEFSAIENEMQHHRDVLSHAAQAVILKNSLSAHRKEQDAHRRELAREREQFLTWLSDYPFEDAHSEIYSKKHPGTGTWLLQRSEYSEWFDSKESAILWCYGKPGAGKSVLASNVIEHITMQCALDAQVGVAFAYYKYEITEMQDSVFIVSALIKQICRRAGTIPESFLQIKQDAYPPSHVANVESFLKAAEHYNLSKVFLVLDALDECPKGRRPEILRCLREIVTRGNNIKMFVTSRPETDIINAFEDLKAPQIKIEAQAIQRDITKYVAEETARLIQGADGRKLYLTNTKLQQRIIDTLSTRAEGMFLWANLQLQHLCEESESRNDHVIEEALTALPSGLEATYLRSLKQMCLQTTYRKEIALRLLKWVMYAARPLMLDEIHEVLMVEEPLSRGQQLDLSFLLSTCSNLLEYIQPDDAVESTFGFRFIHYSVKEYILDAVEFGPRERALTALQDKEVIHSAMACTCVKYLIATLSDAEPCQLISNLRLRIRGDPFLWYAAKCFDIHAIQGKLSDTTNAACERLLQQPSAFLASLLQIRSVRHSGVRADIPFLWNDLPQTDAANPIMLIFSSELFNMGSFDHYWKNLSLPPILLPVACAAGMKDAVEHLLAVGIDSDAVDDEAIPGIYHAAEAGHADIVRCLVDHTTSLSNSKGKYANALQAACAKRHPNVIRMLLEAGADVNALGGFFGTAMQAACYNSDSQTVQNLLDAGADVNIQGGQYGNALQVAAFQGDLPLVQLLINAGADSNAEGGFYGTALQAAIDDTTVQFLLENGADPNRVAGHYGTPLLKATQAGNESVVKLLVTAGAEIDLQPPNHFRALHLAVQKGHDSIIKVLVAHGADLNAAISTAWSDSITPLHLASYHTHLTAAKLLLEAGADPNTTRGVRESPLRAALGYDNPEIIHLLLQYGASPTKCIRQLLYRILRARIWDHLKSDFFALGRSLFLAGDIDAFHHCCTLHWAACDMCNYRTGGKSFMCKECVVTDLCEQCMAKHRAGLGELARCRKHEFIEVVYRDDDDESWVEEVADDVLEWLESVEKKFPDEEFDSMAEHEKNHELVQEMDDGIHVPMVTNKEKDKSEISKVESE